MLTSRSEPPLAAGRLLRGRGAARGRPPTASAIVPVPGGRGVEPAARPASPPPIPPRRRASITAPTAAISSRNDAISNGSRNFVSSSWPICAGRAEGRVVVRALGVDRLQARAEDRDDQLDEQRRAEQRPREAAARGRRRPATSVRAADVGDDEDVEHHHRAGVDHDLGGGDELRAQQQEQRGQAQQVQHERQHANRRVAQHDDPVAPATAPMAAMKKKTSAMGQPASYSPSARSGARSRGSARSISLVKIRSCRL